MPDDCTGASERYETRMTDSLNSKRFKWLIRHFGALLIQAREGHTENGRLFVTYESIEVERCPCCGRIALCNEDEIVQKIDRLMKDNP